MSRLIVVVGFMGCGKSEAANRLANKLGVAFTDLDDLITSTEGRSPAQVLREDGEEVFRAIETKVLSDLLRDKRHAVVALGGGAWIESVNRELIRGSGAITVWLDTPFEVCWKRISTSSEDRPLGSTLETAAARYKKRQPVYGLADIAIKTTGKEDPATIASRIEAAIASLSNS